MVHWSTARNVEPDVTFHTVSNLQNSTDNYSGQMLKSAWMMMFVVCFVAALVVGNGANASDSWAVVAAQDSDKGIADLMMAELSEVEGLQLVERSKIATLLNELKLSSLGLVDHRNAVKFGQFITADAIVVVERVNPNETLRVRLIETRTGVRLADELAAKGDPNKQCAEIARRLLPLRAKLGLGDASRRYLGVVGIRSEEPGSGLDATARTLSVLLEHDLRTLPGVFVLEREHLSRLIAESDLTGAEINLRASSSLLEVGVRRGADPQTWSFSFRLLSLAGGTGSNLKAEAKAEIPAARDVVFKTLANSLQATQDNLVDTSPAALKAEAKLFGMRAQWLISHDRKLDAAPLAEAAFALDPSDKRYRTAMAIFSRLSHDTRRSRHDRLQAALQGSQFDEQFLNLVLRTKSGVKKYPFGYAFSCAYKPQSPSRQELQVLDDTRTLLRDKFDRLLAEFRRHRLPALHLIRTRLKDSHYYADSPEQFCGEVRAMVQELDEETRLGHFPRLLVNGPYESYFNAVYQNLDHATNIRSRPPQPNWKQIAIPWNWGPKKIVPLLEWLAAHEDPLTKLLGLFGLSRQEGKPGAEAARAFLELWIGGFEDQGKVHSVYLNEAVEKVALRLHEAGEFVPWFEAVLASVEKENDVTKLIFRSHGVGACMFVIDRTKTVAWTERVIAMLSAEAYDPHVKITANWWKGSLVRGVERLRGVRKEPLSAEGWKKYDVRKLLIEGRTREMYVLEHATIDRSPGADKPVVLVWRGRPRIKDVRRPQPQPGLIFIKPPRYLPRPSGDVIVTRMSVLGGQLTEIGRFKTDDFLTTCVAASPTGVIALGSRNSGVAVVSPAGVKRFTSKDGIPEASVKAAAWLKGRLYLAFPGALGHLKVDSGKFTILASSRAVQPNSPLDGGSMYQVLSLLADPRRECLWLSVDERPARTRSGIWWIAADGKIHNAFAGPCGHLSWTDEGFTFLRGYESSKERKSWHFFDNETRETRALRGFKVGYPTGIHNTPGWVYITGDIIRTVGYLETPAGEKYRHETEHWDQPLGRLRSGLVCVSFRQPALWYIEPRRSAPPTRSGE